MEVQYKTIVEDIEGTSFYGGYRSYVFRCLISDCNFSLKEDACCKQMKGNWNDGLVVLERSNMEGIPEVQLEWRKYEDDYSGSVEINYCPWCGEEITLKEVDRVRRVRKEKIVNRQEVVYEYEELRDE